MDNFHGNESGNCAMYITIFVQHRTWSFPFTLLELILVEIVAPVKVKRFYFYNANLSKNNAFFLVKFKEHNVLLKYKSTFKLELKP